jgi:RND family efflux transporter MFP subunit
MKIKILVLVMILYSISLLLVSGCAKEMPGKKTDSIDQREIPVPVMVNKINLSDLEEYLNFTAKLEGITDIIMVSESNGRVKEIDKNLGNWVNKGETIGRISNDSYLNQLEQAKASLLASEAALELAEMQRDATFSLYEAQKLSRSEFVLVQSNYKQAQAAYESAQAILKQSELNVLNAQFAAPVSGYISDLKLEVGSYISMGQQVCRLVDNSKLVIKTGIGQKDIIGIKTGQQVLITSEFDDRILYGKITGSGIAPVNGSINYPVEIELENPDRSLLPGMVISGKILRNTYNQVIYTSMNNLTQIYDEYFVYVINSASRAELHKVELGKQIGRNVIIKSGIEPGDLLVIEGSNSLSDNTLVEIKD